MYSLGTSGCLSRTEESSETAPIANSLLDGCPIFLKGQCLKVVVSFGDFITKGTPPLGTAKTTELLFCNFLIFRK
jgi:hypothetical protein